MADATFFVHGSTIIINALTERKEVNTGLITTKGFRDVLEITRANRPDIYNMVYTKPQPFVPRYLRLEAREKRVNYKGEELEPLDEDDVCQAAEFFRREGIEAIAVCFLHSYANLVVGRINPDYFLGGEIRVSMDKARQSMQEIANSFGMNIEETALGVIRVADANMVNALKLVSVRRGYDPREFT